MSNRFMYVILIVFALVLSACKFPLLKAEEPSDIDLLSTAVAQTVQAMSVVSQAATQTPQPAATLSGAPTLTLQPTSTIQGPPTNTPHPCNKAEFVGETIPDNTEFNMGASFTKSWTLKNTGTCTWNTAYKLVFVSGDSMSGPATVSLTKNVAPGEQVTVSADLKAPATAGTYLGGWGLKGDDNQVYANFYVRIKVTSPAFQVTSVVFSMADTTVSMACPGTVNVDATITSSAAGRVTYYWTDSAGATGAEKSNKFTEAGSKTVEYDMSIAADGDYWVKLYVNDPNHQLFGPQSFSVDCTP